MLGHVKVGLAVEMAALLLVLGFSLAQRECVGLLM